jgi:hypothetical protein
MNIHVSRSPVRFSPVIDIETIREALPEREQAGSIRLFRSEMDNFYPTCRDPCIFAQLYPPLSLDSWLLSGLESHGFLASRNKINNQL